jgi:DNA-binding GntR family transcriptional regulator
MFAGFGNRTPDGPRRFLGIHRRIVDLLLKRDVAGATQLMSEHMQIAKQQALRGYFGAEAAGAMPRGDDDGQPGSTRRAAGAS